MSEQLADKIPERYEGQRKVNKDVGNLAFPYSLYFVFYEQYAFIQVTLLTGPRFRLKWSGYCRAVDGFTIDIARIFQKSDR